MLRRALEGLVVRVAASRGAGPGPQSQEGAVGWARGFARRQSVPGPLWGGQREWLVVERPGREAGNTGSGAGKDKGKGTGEGHGRRARQGQGQRQLKGQGKGRGKGLRKGPEKWDRGKAKGGFIPREPPIGMLGKDVWPNELASKGWTASKVMEAARRRVVRTGTPESGWLMRQRFKERPVFESPRMVRDMLFLHRHGFDKVAQQPGYVYYSLADWRRMSRRFKERVHQERLSLQPKLPEGYEFVPGTQNTVMQPAEKGTKQLQPHLHFTREKWALLGPVRRAMVLRAHRVLRKLRRRTWLRDRRIRRLKLYDEIVIGRRRAKNAGRQKKQPVSDVIAARADQLRRGLQKGSVAVPLTRMDTASQLEDRSKLGWKRGKDKTDDALMRSAAVIRHGKQKGVDALKLPFSPEFLAEIRDPFYPERLPWQMNRREWENASLDERRHGRFPPTELIARAMSSVHYNAAYQRKESSRSLAKPYRIHADDTGGTAVQVVRLTERLKALDAHVARGRNHDKDAKRTRLLVSNRRESLLKYLLTRCGKKGKEQHAELLKKFDITHHHDLKHMHLGQIMWVRSDPRGKPQTEERLVKQANLRRRKLDKRERLLRQRGKKTREGLKIKERSAAVRKSAMASGDTRFLRQQGISPRQQLRIDANEARQARGQKAKKK